MKINRIFIAFLLIFSIFHFPLPTNAQVRPVNDYGAIGLAQLLKRLNTTKSVMMIGAHPDDEDSALLAFLARGENARTAYLSLTRGDGGQNVIGKELFESLGVIRTEELLQARRLDGAEQFFTRAFDYGFSKTLTEAREKWDEKIILCDAVRAIRNFRPLVVIARFSGTPADGHGQHQYAGYISPLAVRAAADATQCKDSGAVWQVQKFYVEQGFRSNETATLKINTGAYDSLLGRSYAEIAAEGRSLHRTQEQGGLELKGDRFSGLNLVESQVPKIENEKSVFDGIDVTISGIPKLANLSENESVINLFKEFQSITDRTAKQNLTSAPNEILPLLIRATDLIANIRLSIPKFITRANSKDYLEKQSELTNLLDQRELILEAAVKNASGIQIDALSSKETVTPNENFLASVKVFYPQSSNVKIKAIKLNTPNNWQIADAAEPKNDSQFANFFRETAKDAKFFNVKVAANANLTEPYFLEKTRVGALYQPNADADQTLPFQKSPVTAQITAEINGTEIVFTQPIEYRFADGVRGEIRRDLNVVLKLSLNLDQNLILVSGAEKSHDRNLILTITNNSAGALSGTAKLNLPDGWQAVASSQNFSLKNKGEKTSVKFVVTVPRNYKTGNYAISAEASANGEVLTKTLNEIAYPHIQTHRFYTDARAQVDVLDLKVAPVKVGYIMGSGDDVPEAIRQMNLTVDLLSETDLTAENLAKYDVIVAGIRAFNVRQDLISNNQTVLDFVRNGGTLIVQYQRPDYVANNLQPFPASQTDTQKTTAGTTARVVDETAKVTILEPTNPVFNFPNKISDADFANWVQERNLYNFTTFDAKYTALLESHDAGELENKGGMVYAKIGKGNFVYTSYSFFRQLPAGNAGAFRLFANLLSVPKSGK